MEAAEPDQERNGGRQAASSDADANPHANAGNGAEARDGDAVRRETRKQQQLEDRGEQHQGGERQHQQLGVTQTPSASSSTTPSPSSTAGNDAPFDTSHRHNAKEQLLHTTTTDSKPTDNNPQHTTTDQPLSDASAQARPSASAPDTDPHPANPSQSPGPSPDAAGADSNPHSASKKHRACEPCRALKVRCDPLPPDVDPTGTGPCKRCAKARRACVVTEPARKRQKRAGGAGDNSVSRVAELERKIDLLAASLGAAAGGYGRGISADMERARQREQTGASPRGGGYGGVPPPQQRSTSNLEKSPSLQQQQRIPGSAANPEGPRQAAGQKRRFDERDEPAAGQPGLGPDAASWFQPTPPPPKQTPPDIIDQDMLTMGLATELFQRYTNHMCGHLPAVVFPPSMTAAELRATKPTLFLAILATASSEMPALQRNLTHELMKELADKIVVRGQKSIELVQALQVASIWYWPPDRFEELKFYQLVHMAVIMALDLGLGRRRNVRGGAPRHLPLNLKDHPLRKNPLPDSTTIEARRIWVTCYFMATNTSMALHRPNLLRWTPFLAECMDVLSTSPDAAPTDKYLVHIVWTHRVADEIGIHFSVDDPAATPSLAEPRTQYLLRWFESKLERYRNSISNLKQQPLLEITFHVISLYLHEIATYTDPLDDGKTNVEMMISLNEPLTTAHVDAFIACLTAIHGIVDVFLSLDVHTIRCLPVFNFVRLAYAVVVLIKLYFAVSSSKSDLPRILGKDQMKVEYYLDNLLEKFRGAAAEDRCRPAAKFAVVLVMLRSWFRKQEEKQRQGRASGSGADGPPTPAYQRQNVGERPPVPQPPSHHADYSTTASTPLQLLSEIATNDSATRPSCNAADLIQPSGPSSTSLHQPGTSSWMSRSSVVYDPATASTTQQPRPTAPTPDTNQTTPAPSTATNATSTTATGFMVGTNPPPPHLSSMPWLDSSSSTTTAGTATGTASALPDFDYPGLTANFGTGFGDGFAQAMDLTMGGFGFGFGGFGFGDQVGGAGPAAVALSGGFGLDEGVLGFLMTNDVAVGGGGSSSAAPAGFSGASGTTRPGSSAGTGVVGTAAAAGGVGGGGGWS